MKPLVLIVLSMVLHIPLLLIAQDIKLGIPSGHTKGVNSVHFSPDGQYIATASDDLTARIWEVESGKVLHVLDGHSDKVTIAEFSPNGLYILTASDDNAAIIWDLESGKILHKLIGHTDDISSAQFSPDSRFIVTGSGDETAKIWDVESGKVVHILEGHIGAIDVAQFSSNGRYLVTGAYLKARLWEVESGRLLHILEGHSDDVTVAQFSPNGRYVVTANGGNWNNLGTPPRIWEVESGSLLQILEGHELEVYSAQFSPDSRFLLTASHDNTARIWDVTSGKVVDSLSGHYGKVNSAYYSPDGRYIVTVNISNVRIFEAESGQLLHELMGNTGDVNDAQFSQDGRYLVTASSQNTATVWQVGSGTIVQILKGNSEEAKTVQYSPDGQYYIKSNWDLTALLCEASTDSIVHVLGRYYDWVAPQFSPNGQHLVTLYEKEVSLWDVESGKLVNTLKGHKKFVNSAQFSPDGQYIVTASDDKTVQIWEVESGKLTYKIKGYNEVAVPHFIPDGRYIAVAKDDNSTAILDIESGEPLHSLVGHDGLITATKFSPNGQFLLTRSRDRTVRVWHSLSGELLQIIKVPNSWFTFAKFSPEGKYILTVAGDNSAHIWETSTGKIIHTIEGHIDLENSAHFSEDSRYFNYTTTNNSKVSLRIEDIKELLYSFTIQNNPKNWLHLHPSGLFDASPEAMELMYWTKGLEVIEFEQLKDRYWLPGLWEKVMNAEPLPDTRGMDKLRLQPEVELGEVEDGMLPINLTKRDGGYGKVSIFINGKEVIQDARGEDLDTAQASQTLTYNIQNHPYLIDGENTISVSASSADGFVQGRPVQTRIFFKKEEKDPQFFGVVIGVSEYANDFINLKYPKQDAAAIATAMELGARNLFGEDRTYVYSITSESEQRPTKDNIEALFNDIESKSNPEDVIFVYLSGHGITWGGEQGDFYYLTADATSSSSNAYNDAVIREKATISTNEWVEWLKDIPALKQVMIIDACGSGKAVDNLLAARDIEASQIKAIDRMKDRTGMFILSGCAADAQSYEASQYGQGLLTYAVLEALKGAALKQDGSIDIAQVMQHARERVPSLAAGVGGIQEPQVLVPKGGSFDVGILDEEDRKKVPLNTPKKIFIRSQLLDADAFEDALGLSTLVDQELAVVASKGAQAPIVFFDAKDFPDACKVSGIYQQGNEGISVQLKVRCGEEQEVYELQSTTVEELVDQIISKVNQ